MVNLYGVMDLRSNREQAPVSRDSLSLTLSILYLLQWSVLLHALQHGQGTKLTHYRGSGADLRCHYVAHEFRLICAVPSDVFRWTEMVGLQTQLNQAALWGWDSDDGAECTGHSSVHTGCIRLYLFLYTSEGKERVFSKIEMGTLSFVVVFCFFLFRIKHRELIAIKYYRVSTIKKGCLLDDFYSSYLQHSFKQIFIIYYNSYCILQSICITCSFAKCSYITVF